MSKNKTLDYLIKTITSDDVSQPQLGSDESAMHTQLTAILDADGEVRAIADFATQGRLNSQFVVTLSPSGSAETQNVQDTVNVPIESSHDLLSRLANNDLLARRELVQLAPVIFRFAERFGVAKNDAAEFAETTIHLFLNNLAEQLPSANKESFVERLFKFTKRRFKEHFPLESTDHSGDASTIWKECLAVSGR